MSCYSTTWAVCLRGISKKSTTKVSASLSMNNHIVHLSLSLSLRCFHRHSSVRSRMVTKLPIRASAFACRETRRFRQKQQEMPNRIVGFNLNPPRYDLEECCASVPAEISFSRSIGSVWCLLKRASWRFHQWIHAPNVWVGRYGSRTYISILRYPGAFLVRLGVCVLLSLSTDGGNFVLV